MKQILILTLMSLTMSVSAHEASPDSMAARIMLQQQAEDRHQFDLPRDAARKPYELFQFIGVTEGATVLDVGAYAGYTTEMLSAAVGTSGTVYSHNTQRVLNDYADGYYKRTMTERLANSRLPNVKLHLREYDDLGLTAEIDVAFLGNLLHDFYNRDGETQALRFLASIYQALKPGGTLGVMDHVGLPDKNNGALHRMTPQLAEELTTAAGFVIRERSKLFSNPNDDYTVNVYHKRVYLQTDRFLFRAIKPAE